MIPTIGVIKGDTRSLDNDSNDERWAPCSSAQEVRWSPVWVPTFVWGNVGYCAA